MTNKHSLRNVRSLACAMLLTTGSLLPLGAQKTNNAPAPILPLPEQRQVDWQKMETYAFIHFGLNTFNDREWGYGDTPAETFNPTRLDCNQWVATLKAAGMKGVIFTAKHHDGFCLWPFKGTDYNVAHSPFRGGKGDVVRELQEACKKQGMKFAVYISPWDRNRADYGTPAYLDYYYAQIRDLLSNYGEVFEIWFDGANGGDGWYGGANDRRTIDRRTYYKFENIQALCDSLQPKAVMFSDGGPGCRWVGNERGIAGATNWAFLRKNTVYPGYPKHYELQYGHADGDQWTPSECDVSIRPGWFYHAQQDNQVKSPQQLADIYYRSVGHNGTMLLNFPVNRDGLIHSIDSTNAVKFREIIDNDFKTNLIAMITQIGYALGLLFIVPLGDLYRRKNIILTNFFLLIFSLLAIAMAPNIYIIWAASLITGICSMIPQIFVPIASQFSRPENKGRNVGVVISGLLTGILASRVVSGFVGEVLGWREMYFIAAGMMLLCAIVVLKVLPDIQPTFQGKYSGLMKSLFSLVREYPSLRIYSIRAGLAFGSFLAMWSCLAFKMGEAPFHASSDVIGILGLCGIAGALTASFVGKYVKKVGIRNFNFIGCGMILLA